MAIKMKRYPFYVGITTLIVAIVVSLTALFLWISHRESRAAAIQLADRLFSEVNEKVLERYENTLASVAVLAGSAAHMQGMHRLPVGGGLTHPGTELMLEFLSFYDDLFSTYAGYADGSFIQLMAVRNHPGLLKLFDAPPGTFYVLRTISENADGKLQQHWHFLNAHRQVTGARPDLDPDYDPRTRPWYIRARREPKAFFTQPMSSVPRACPASPVRSGWLPAAGCSAPTSPLIASPNPSSSKTYPQTACCFFSIATEESSPIPESLPSASRRTAP